jgi:hypothetical protein
MRIYDFIISSSAFFIIKTVGKVFFARFNAVSEIRHMPNLSVLSTLVALINPYLQARCSVKKSLPNIFQLQRLCRFYPFVSSPKYNIGGNQDSLTSHKKVLTTWD